MMTTNDTISEIIRINPTANAAFLSQFAPHELAEYLQRLADLRAQRRSSADDAASRKPASQTVGSAA